MSRAPAYHAVLYMTTTGRIVGEIPMVDVPSWLQQINADGSWSINTEVGMTDDDGNLVSSLLSKDRLWPILQDSWRYSIAIVWGTARSGYICQAGPFISWAQTSEDPPLVTMGGAGLWALLRATLQVSAGWSGTSISDGTGDTTYMGDLRYIAQQLMANAKVRNPIPLDIVLNPGTGDSRSYLVSDFVSAGQELQELTQADGGPDVLLKAVFADSNHIKHQALVGNPDLVTAATPMLFGYGRQVSSILPSGDGSTQATDSFGIGNGTGDTKLWARASDPTLPAAGWPHLESVDTLQTDDPDQNAVQQKVTADQKLNGKQAQTWSVSVLMDNDSNPFGSYDSGARATYNVRGHSLLPDGPYPDKRILGLQNDAGNSSVKHILEAT